MASLKGQFRLAGLTFEIPAGWRAQEARRSLEAPPSPLRQKIVVLRCHCSFDLVMRVRARARHTRFRANQDALRRRAPGTSAVKRAGSPHQPLATVPQGRGGDASEAGFDCRCRNQSYVVVEEKFVRMRAQPHLVDLANGIASFSMAVRLAGSLQARRSPILFCVTWADLLRGLPS